MLWQLWRDKQRQLGDSCEDRQKGTESRAVGHQSNKTSGWIAPGAGDRVCQRCLPGAQLCEQTDRDPCPELWGPGGGARRVCWSHRVRVYLGFL